MPYIEVMETKNQNENDRADSNDRDEHPAEVSRGLDIISEEPLLEPSFDKLEEIRKARGIPVSKIYGG